MRTILAILTLLFAAVAPVDTVYQLVNYGSDQAGCLLAGSVTTDGATGLLSDSDVLSWKWILTDCCGRVLASASSTESNAGEFSCNLYAGPICLTVDDTACLALQGDIDSGPEIEWTPPEYWCETSYYPQ